MNYTYIALALSIATTVCAMERDESLLLGDELPLLLNSANRISNDLAQAIKLGKTNQIDALLKRGNVSTSPLIGHTQDFEQLATSLGFAERELILQRQHNVQKVCGHFWTRYKHAAFPALLTACSVANLVYGVIAYKMWINNSYIVGVPGEIKASFGLRVPISILTALGSGWYTVRQIKKGWTDHRQKEKVEQLESSEAMLLATAKIKRLERSLTAAGIKVPAATEEIGDPANDNSAASLY